MKTKYNLLLARWKKAQQIEKQLSEKHIHKLKELSTELSTILESIGDYTVEEGINGFIE